MLRQTPPMLPETSELDVVRHYTGLSQKNFSIDTQFYPLGSCTMKYNPRACNTLAMLPQFLSRHPLSDVETGQGFLLSMFELQEMLKEVTGMAAVSMALERNVAVLLRRPQFALVQRLAQRQGHRPARVARLDDVGDEEIGGGNIG